MIRLEDVGRVEKYLRRCFGLEVAKRLRASSMLVLDSRGGAVYSVPRDRYELLKDLGLDPDLVVAAGTHIGWMVEGMFVPSVGLFRLAKSLAGEVRGCAAVCTEQGVKAFLYGNDILVASIKRVIEPFERGLFVAVIDDVDGEVIGVGLAVVDSQQIDELRKRGAILEPAILNVFDLGASIRSEKLFMEIPRDRLKSLYRRVASRR